MQLSRDTQTKSRRMILIESLDCKLSAEGWRIVTWRHCIKTVISTDAESLFNGESNQFYCGSYTPKDAGFIFRKTFKLTTASTVPIPIKLLSGLQTVIETICIPPAWLEIRCKGRNISKRPPLSLPQI
jgi:hypothetical protein